MKALPLLIITLLFFYSAYAQDRAHVPPELSGPQAYGESEVFKNYVNENMQTPATETNSAVNVAF